MGRALQVLIVEDSENDLLLLLNELRWGGYEPTFERVETEAEMEAAFGKKDWEIILSDYSLPHFSAPAALALLKKKGRDIPFVIVSGSIGEAQAVAAMKAGAHDYIMKENLARLCSVIEREVREAAGRRERKETEAQYQTLVSNIPGAVYRCANDPDRTLELISDYIKELTGYPPSDFIGNRIRSFTSIIHPDDREKVKKGIEKGLKRREPYRLEYRIIHADGSLRWMQGQGRGIFPAQGEALSLDGVLFDITDRKRAEEALGRLVEELKQKTLEAEEASRLKTQLISNISHELRTPLNAIIGYTSLLLDESYGAVQKEQQMPLEGVQRNAGDLLRLINELLDLAKVESRRLGVEVGTVDVGALLKEVYSGMEPLFDDKSLSIRWDLERDLPAIESDPGKIKQIVTNLFSNAVKFTVQGGISVRAKNSAARRGIEVAVQDSGIGIQPEAIPRIFEAFYQADGTMTRQYEGAGLGLAIVKELTGLLKGEIGVESKLGEGSTFTLFLPYQIQSSGKDALPQDSV
jgi:PAS domain S-box-containing protein